MRCDNCVNWRILPEGETDWESGRTGFRQCLAVGRKWEIEDKASENMDWEPADDSAYAKARDTALIDARAYVIDGSSYYAALFTDANFFCALFEAKP